MPRTLLLFTESFPYTVAEEATFIGSLVGPLRAAFDGLTIIPWRRGGVRDPVPESVVVDESLIPMVAAARRPTALLARATRSPFVSRELASNPSILVSPSRLGRLIRTAGTAGAVAAWLPGALRRLGIEPSDATAFTFWFDHVTIGLAQAKAQLPGLALAARVNGADLYVERQVPPYLPCRRLVMPRLDRLYAGSDHGLRYVRQRHPAFNRIELMRLGVVDPGAMAARSGAGRFVVASCSGIVSVKRVDRIGVAVRLLAERNPAITVEWHHFGDGPERGLVERGLAAVAPNLTARLYGHVPNEVVLAFYREQPVDAFVNASESEGGAPVAVVEAAAAGIPIVATASGGNPEIARPENAILVAPDASAEEIASGLAMLLDDPERAAGLAAAARELWAREFDAALLAPAFARSLAAVRPAP